MKMTDETFPMSVKVKSTPHVTLTHAGSPLALRVDMKRTAGPWTLWTPQEEAVRKKRVVVYPVTSASVPPHLPVRAQSLQRPD